MGCFASIAAPDLIMLDSLGYGELKEKVDAFNEFYKETREHMKGILEQDAKIDQHLIRLLQEAKSAGSLEKTLAESYIYIVLFILHYSRVKGKELGLNPKFNEKGEVLGFRFSNYIPGIFLKKDLLPDKLLRKYENLEQLTGILPEVFAEFKNLGDQIVLDIVMARDRIPYELSLIAKNNKQIGVFDLAQLERTWLDNLEIISEIGRKMDKLFKSAKSCLIIANKTIRKCSENYEDLSRILDLTDEWNYDTIPKNIQDEVQNFIKNHIS